MKYDKQAVLALLSPPVDPIKNMARDLHRKHSAHSLLLHVTNHVGTVIHDGDRALTNNSRLYIVGHGTYAGTTVGGMTGEQVANALYRDTRLTHVGTISVVSCYAGGAPGSIPTSDLFSVALHRVLGKQFNVRCIVTARQALITTSDNGKKWTHPGPPSSVALNNPYKNKAPNTKIVLEWEDDEQVWSYKY